MFAGHDDLHVGMVCSLHRCVHPDTSDHDPATPASPGCFKVIGTDTFEHPPGSWVYTEWSDLEDAKRCCTVHGATMNPTRIVDDQGRTRFRAGHP